LKSK
jgi:hypothetical protein